MTISTRFRVQGTHLPVRGRALSGEQHVEAKCRWPTSDISTESRVQGAHLPVRGCPLSGDHHVEGPVPRRLLGTAGASAQQASTAQHSAAAPAAPGCPPGMGLSGAVASRTQLVSPPCQDGSLGPASSQLAPTGHQRSASLQLTRSPSFRPGAARCSAAPKTPACPMSRCESVYPLTSWWCLSHTPASAEHVSSACHCSAPYWHLYTRDTTSR